MATYSYFEPDRAGVVSTRKNAADSETDFAVEVLRVDDRFVLRVTPDDGDRQTLWFSAEQADSFRKGVNLAVEEIGDGLD